MSYHIIDLKEQTQPNIVCPQCQHAVLDWAQTQYIQPCEHTAFIALDLGFEYISDRFEHTLKVTVDEIHDHDLNVWQQIQASSLDTLMIYTMNLGVADYKRYVGFVVSS
ncbi:hypothetical protein I2F27_03650 [Acinetobacter sp. B5B]|uniref:hypothetical protein n=1 Tax=Acinetobacter baretiae TaxID=2605383 RepID=UPI0018C1E3AA|nr:hypothetical protein [Acinetobacter baretiae]MBF7682426.1 hypothetical protein [Acinetobacter baretiae]MBF7685306.1 hypothetical protein [Acinetobacter baretiae]